MDLERDDLVEYLSRLFLQKILQELDNLDAAGLLVDEDLLNRFNLTLKTEMSRESLIPDDELIDEAIDKAFVEIVRIRQHKH